MSKSRRISIGAINIALHDPHAAEQYLQLFHQAFRHQGIVRMGSVHAMLLGSLGKPEAHGGRTVLHGELYRFIKLDPDQPWFDVQKKEQAAESDVDKINIPEHLLPHLQRFPFVFDVRRHRLWYVAREQSNSLAPPTAARFLERLLQQTARAHDLPEVSVTAVPDQGSVQRILEMPVLEVLRIELVRPNPDDGQAVEERWERRLRRQHANRIKVELTHADDQALAPDAETREMAEVAANNGKVYGRGRNARGQRIEDSTSARPMLRHATVDPAIETTGHVLDRVALG